MIKIRLYFVSEKNFDNKILMPRIPKTISSHEDEKVKRICVSPSLYGALSAIDHDFNTNTMYIHICESNDIYQPTLKQVGDSGVTGELWLLKPTKMRLEYKCHIDKYTIEKYHTFYHIYNKNKNIDFSLYDYESNKLCWDKYYKKGLINQIDKKDLIYHVQFNEETENWKCTIKKGNKILASKTSGTPRNALECTEELLNAKERIK